MSARIAAKNAANKTNGNIAGNSVLVKAQFAECSAGTHMIRWSKSSRAGSTGF